MVGLTGPGRLLTATFCLTHRPHIFRSWWLFSSIHRHVAELRYDVSSPQPYSPFFKKRPSPDLLFDSVRGSSEKCHRQPIRIRRMNTITHFFQQTNTVLLTLCVSLNLTCSKCDKPTNHVTATKSDSRQQFHPVIPELYWLVIVMYVFSYHPALAPCTDFPVAALFPLRYSYQSPGFSIALSSMSSIPTYLALTCSLLHYGFALPPTIIVYRIATFQSPTAVLRTHLCGIVQPVPAIANDRNL